MGAVDQQSHQGAFLDGLLGRQLEAQCGHVAFSLGRPQPKAMEMVLAVKSEIHWNDNGNPRSLSLSTLRMAP